MPFLFPLNSTVGLTVVHDPRVYRLKAGTTVSDMRAFPISTWDSHHFDQLGSNALCEEQTLTFITAIIIVDDVYYHLPLTPSAHLHMWCFRAAVGRRVCALLLRFCGTEEGEYSTAQKEHPTIPPSYIP